MEQATTQMTRDEMILSEQKNVFFIAYSVYRKKYRAQTLTLQDLISAGQLGLIKAVDRYDGRVKLNTYAKHCIRGAILDYLRIEAKRGFTFQIGAMAREKFKPQEHEFRGCGSLENAPAVPYVVEFPDREVWEITRLRAAVAKLPERLQFVLDERYHKDEDYKDIGKKLGVGECRAWNLHSSAITKLRALLVQ